MPDMIIVVPGITGSVLSREGKPFWDQSLTSVSRNLAAIGRVLREMSLPEIGDEAPDARHALEPTGLIRGWHVWPGFWAGMGYGKLLHRLREAAPGRVLEFPYDWRLSNVHSARRLQRFTERALRDRPDTKVTFVCHSMGGLVARYYLEVLGGRHDAAQLITVGTPFSGSIKAVRALAGDLFPRAPRLGTALTEAARTFPSVAELLPTYRCAHRSVGEEPRILAEVDVPGLPTEPAARGRAFHDEINAAIAANGEPCYTTHVFAGKLQDTEQSIALDGGVVGYRRSQRGTDHAGDGTVPRFSAVPPEWDDTARAVYRAARHSALIRSDIVSDDGIIEDIIDKINYVDLRAAMAPAQELSLSLPDSASAADPSVPVGVTAKVPDLLLQATVRDLTGQIVDDHIPVEPDGSGEYGADLELPAGTWHVTVAAVAESPPAVVDDIVTVV